MTARHTPAASDSRPLVLRSHRRDGAGAYEIVFTDAQVRDPDFDLAAFARRVIEQMAAERRSELPCPVPEGTPSWSMPLTLAFLNDDHIPGGNLNEWLRYRLLEARARTVTPI